jgi:hypothetical protein
MKKILFVCSHLYSGSSALFEMLNQHPKIQGYNIAPLNFYTNPLNLLSLTEQDHKLNNRSAIYMDHLLFNHHLSTKAAYQECEFVYVVREPRAVLNFLVRNEKLKPIFALRYYTYRLRRLCEMAKRTPGAVLLTWDDLVANRGMSFIEEYLGLKQKIQWDNNVISHLNESFLKNLVSLEMVSEAEIAYQQYLYYLKNQNIRYWI